MKKVIFVPLVALAIIGTSCKSNSNVDSKPQTLDLANLDTSVNPKTDFYQYACGGWMKAHPLTGEYSRYGSFDKLAEDNQEQLRTLIEGLAANTANESGDALKIGTLFNVAMDSTKLNADGYSPIKEDLAAIAGMKDKKDAFDMLVQMHLTTSSPFFAFYVSSDPGNSTANLFQLYQAGTGLPDRDYYLKEEHKPILDAYKAHVQRMFQLCGFSENEAKAKMEQVLKMETALAKLQMDKVSLRDPHLSYNKMSVDELQKKIPGFDWKSYIKAISPNHEVKELSAGQMDFMKGMAQLFAKTDLDDIKAYYEWNLISSASSYLSDAFVEANFDFYGRTMSGQTE